MIHDPFPVESSSNNFRLRKIERARLPSFISFGFIRDRIAESGACLHAYVVVVKVAKSRTGVIVFTVVL